MLSQPLTSLRGSVEVALMGELDQCECRQVLELVLQDSHRMAETLQTLREVLEIEGPGENAEPVSWTQSVEKSLGEFASVHKNRDLQLISNVTDEVWVKASPDGLSTATRKLIGWVIKEKRGRQVVRVGLSVSGGTARLSVCDESFLADAILTPNESQKPFSPETEESRDLDLWIVRRTIERQGGSLEINEVSEVRRCYQLFLPLAELKVGRQP